MLTERPALHEYAPQHNRCPRIYAAVHGDAFSTGNAIVRIPHPTHVQSSQMRRFWSKGNIQKVMWIRQLCKKGRVHIPLQVLSLQRGEKLECYL